MVRNNNSKREAVEARGGGSSSSSSEDEQASSDEAISSRTSRVLLILGGAAVMQLSPGSHERVEASCSGDGGLASFDWFCGLEPGHRVGLCVTLVSSIFLADVVFDLILFSLVVTARILAFGWSCLRETSRETVMLRAREAGGLVVSMGLAARGLLRYVRKAAAFTLRAVGVRWTSSNSSRSTFWPQASIVQQARDRWRAAFESYARMSRKAAKKDKAAKKKAAKRESAKPAPDERESNEEAKFDLRETLCSPPEMKEEDEADRDELAAGWEEAKGWEESKCAPESEPADASESTARSDLSSDDPIDDVESSPQWGARSAVVACWARIARGYEAVVGALADGEHWLFPSLVPGADHDDKRRKRREFPLVFLLLTAIVVVAVTTGIEARQLWTEHAAATNSVERYLATSLVLHIGAAIHESQRERGLASTYLGNRKQSRDALENLERQYHHTDRALCNVFEALLRHADVVSEAAQSGLSLAQPQPHEIAALVAPIFGINANRRRDSPTFRARAAQAGQVCLDDSPADDESKSHCSTSGCAFSADRYGVGAYDCKSARCRQVATILLFLQSAAPSGGSSRKAAAPAPELPPIAPVADKGSGSRAASFEYYTGINRNLLRLATNACVELVRNLRAGPSLAASLLYAYVNLAAFIEKAAVERGIISTELAFALTADPNSVLVRHRKALVNLHRKAAGDAPDAAAASDDAVRPRSPSLSALVRLREVVAQQDVYLSSFIAFATPAYVATYDKIRAESCVMTSHSMRASLIDRLHDIEISLSAGGFFDYAPDLLDDAAQYVLNAARPNFPTTSSSSPPAQQQSTEPTSAATAAATAATAAKQTATRRRTRLSEDEEEDADLEVHVLAALREMSENDSLWFTPQHWWANQTCRIDHLHAMSETLALTIHREAEHVRRTLSVRAVRLAAPLLACFVVTLLVGLRAIHAYIQYRDSTERRVKKLETRRLRYRDLLSRWAPLSSWMLDDDSHDDDSSTPSVAASDCADPPTAESPEATPPFATGASSFGWLRRGRREPSVVGPVVDRVDTPVKRAAAR